MPLSSALWLPPARWGERELHGAYYNGLSERLLDELSTCELPASLESLVDLTLRIEARLVDRCTSRHLRDPERPWETPRTQCSTSICTLLKHQRWSLCKWGVRGFRFQSDNDAGRTTFVCTAVGRDIYCQPVR